MGRLRSFLHVILRSVTATLLKLIPAPTAKDENYIFPDNAEVGSKIDFKNRLELKIATRSLRQAIDHLVYLRKCDFRKIRSIIDAIEIGGQAKEFVDGTVISEAEECGLPERTYYLAIDALQYRLDKNVFRGIANGEPIDYQSANHAISILLQCEDRVSSYILYKVSKKSDVTIALTENSHKRDVYHRLEFQTQRELALRALKQRGYGDTDPIHDEFINLVEDRSVSEVAQIQHRIRMLQTRISELQGLISNMAGSEELGLTAEVGP